MPVWGPTSLSLSLSSATEVTQLPPHINFLAVKAPTGKMGGHQVDADCMDGVGKAPSTHYVVHFHGFVVVAERITKFQYGKGPTRHDE